MQPIFNREFKAASGLLEFIAIGVRDQPLFWPWNMLVSLSRALMVVCLIFRWLRQSGDFRISTL